jgi:hypothetical protein
VTKVSIRHDTACTLATNSAPGAQHLSSEAKMQEASFVAKVAPKYNSSVPFQCSDSLEVGIGSQVRDDDKPRIAYRSHLDCA